MKVDIKGSGTVGLITYMRTDSTRVCLRNRVQRQQSIGSNYGADYAGEVLMKKKYSKIQDAHGEVRIRPTDLNRSPAAVKESLSRDLFQLYQLIWNRFAGAV